MEQKFFIGFFLLIGIIIVGLGASLGIDRLRDLDRTMALAKIEQFAKEEDEERKRQEERKRERERADFCARYRDAGLDGLSSVCGD